MGSLSVLVLLLVTLPRQAWVCARLVTAYRDGRSYRLCLLGRYLARLALVCARLVTAHCDGRSYLHYRSSCLREMLLDLLALDLSRGNGAATVLLNDFLLHGEGNGLRRRRRFGDDCPIQRAIRRFRHVHRRCSGANHALCLWLH